jgi:hypothetical protein
MPSHRMFAFGVLLLVGAIAVEASLGPWFATTAKPAAAVAFAVVGAATGIASIVSNRRGAAIAGVCACGYAFALAAWFGYTTDGVPTLRLFAFLATMIAAIGSIALPFAVDER